MYKIEQVLGEDILLRYKEIKIELEKALKYSSGEWSASQIVTKTISEPHLFHIWEISKDGSIVAIGSTRVLQYNNFVALHIITLGGKNIYDEMPNLITIFENIVKEYEIIDVLEYTGRRGFIKQLSTVGWEERYTTMRKSLKENLDV